MAKGPPVDYEAVTKKTLHAAARLFLEQGYHATSVQQIANRAGVGKSAMLRAMESKGGILCELVRFVLNGQFTAAKELLDGRTDDPVFYYAAETTLQLYMAESDEAIRDLYGAAYSIPETSELIRRSVSENLLGMVFRGYLPDHTAQDFYKLEIASGGIMRGYMTVPCTADLPMEEKVRLFLTAALPIFGVPPEEVREAVGFVKQFDFPTAAKQTVAGMFASLEESGP